MIKWEWLKKVPHLDQEFLLAFFLHQHKRLQLITSLLNLYL